MSDRHFLQAVQTQSGSRDKAPRYALSRRYPRDRNHGAQGRNRTTDTAIFSRMLYQLSYLGIRGVEPTPWSMGRGRPYRMAWGRSSRLRRFFVGVVLRRRDAILSGEPTPKVLGSDFSEAMTARARAAAIDAGSDNVVFCRADAERLPLPDASIDIALANGIFNLNPERAAIFRELARVLRAGGAVYAAELVLAHPLPPGNRTAADWFA